LNDCPSSGFNLKTPLNPPVVAMSAICEWYENGDDQTVQEKTMLTELLALAAFQELAAPIPPISDFNKACVQAGGSTGHVPLPNPNSQLTILLYDGPMATLVLSVRGGSQLNLLTENADGETGWGQRIDEVGGLTFRRDGPVYLTASHGSPFVEYCLFVRD